MHGVSVQRRVPLTLAEYGDPGSVVSIDLDMYLGPLAIVFCLGPYFIRCFKEAKGMRASTTLHRLRYLRQTVSEGYGQKRRLLLTSMGVPSWGAVCVCKWQLSNAWAASCRLDLTR